MPSVLILHGLSSHPVLTVGPLPQALRQAGYQVAQPTLPGHGTRPEDLQGVRWQDWYRVALEAYRALPSPKAAVGLSMGGLLAAKIAAEEAPQALVAMVPALGFVNKTAYLAPYLSWAIPIAKGTASVRDAERKAKSPNYPWIPTAAVAELVKLQRTVDPLLPKVKAPAFVLQARYDSTIPEVSVRRFYERLGSAQKQYRVYESEHDLLLDSQAEQVAADIREWLREILPV
ncbi:MULTISPECIES: carboxylesterase [unclassified Meiothermus]|uniref:alpha/beta hydrolase n=1 Tax=unclassified Meiothermus TaxID=370471 RepID=UPI000D7D0DAA|nr:MULTISPECIES: alpha/beta fold hydrolase [unclassified Meiothermus]PZA06698.1 carboxylesterase [Meiothermus sp. Pnk-1]RYM36624.1 alpha/beta fold hydrolase [Meiothermus sp. PNK-Is4]